MIHLIPFNELDDSETMMILSWRNHPYIRKWMIHSEVISMEEHLRFIESLSNRSDKQYFLVRDAKKYLGVVDLTDITANGAELGLYSNPDLHGVGKLLLSALIEYAFETLKLTKITANVFADNERAKHLYQIFDLVETARTVYNGREMITMERIL
ncbi:UDP-4-amino-4,6-dideoxy-N-acetyl-beta-L-altrosamine N-acetyltransferase [Sulfuricurvum sp.]|uniref:UDP-4-amino-4, 6-dideoxy-N-acetyl-beta-L-altrosamine N-acetyltransferase n=1 Tax=Sulfuricurvum sp. TaxID=2025608 RepID=UPI003566CCF5